MRNLGLLLPLLTLCLLASCAPCKDVVCEACGPALTVTFVDDVTSAALTGGDIDHPQKSCEADGSRCYVNENRAGDFHFVASVPGYQDQNVETTVLEGDLEGCCSCGYVETLLELRMTPR